jgi:hypothetical protein
MPKTAALEALLKAYRAEIDWLFDKAKEHEGNSAVAQDYIHRARNLQAVIAAYERLDAKDTNRAQRA